MTLPLAGCCTLTTTTTNTNTPPPILIFVSSGRLAGGSNNVSFSFSCRLLLVDFGLHTAPGTARTPPPLGACGLDSRAPCYNPFARPETLLLALVRAGNLAIWRSDHWPHALAARLLAQRSPRHSPSCLSPLLDLRSQSDPVSAILTCLYQRWQRQRASEPAFGTASSRPLPRLGQCSSLASDLLYAHQAAVPHGAISGAAGHWRSQHSRPGLRLVLNLASQCCPSGSHRSILRPSPEPPLLFFNLLRSTS